MGQIFSDPARRPAGPRGDDGVGDDGAVGFVEDQLAGRVELDAEAALVDETVVTTAHEAKVSKLCLTAVEPVLQVMPIDVAAGTASYVSRHITGFMWRA